MINRAILTGRLTKDVDLRYTKSGTAVGTFNLAVKRRFKSANDETESDFIECVIWRKSAENLANFTHKGSLIGVEGRIQTRNYENNQGNRVYVTEVVVENFSLLEPKSNSKNTGANSNNGYSQGQDNSANEASQNSTQSGHNPAASDPFADSSEPIDISDDDLPF